MTTPTIELKPSSNPLSDAEREAILASPASAATSPTTW